MKYLEHFRFKGKIYSTNEGDIVFPVMPILQVEAIIIEAHILETIVLNINSCYNKGQPDKTSCRG